MMRWIAGAIIGALVIAPGGFGLIDAAAVAALARIAAAALVGVAILLSALDLFWSRRWSLER